MGIFDSIKKGLGLSRGEFELKIQPETLHIGGEVQGSVLFRAHKEINVVSLSIELHHSYPDNYGDPYREVRDGVGLEERVSYQEQQVQEYPFFFKLPPQLAPSMGPFRWFVVARAVLQGGQKIEKELELKVRLSPIMGAITGLLKDQFGFVFREAGADDEGLWIDFRPTPAIQGHFDQLTLSWDEQDEELTLWLQPRPIRPDLMSRFGHVFDRSDGSFEIELEKRDYAAGPGQVDAQGLMGVIRPFLAL